MEAYINGDFKTEQASPTYSDEIDGYEENDLLIGKWRIKIEINLL